MKAQKLIEGENFDPETLSVIYKAFDAAWAEIAQQVGPMPSDIERGRTRLAHAILLVAREDSRDVEPLKKGALEIIALINRERFE